MNRFKLLYSQPKELFEALDWRNMGVVLESERHIPMFIEGEKYALKGVCCDGFDMETKVYKIIKVVDEFCGEKIDSLIVKQVSGNQDIIFTLSKNDCKYHDIEFENGLQLFPKNLPWIKVRDEIEFNPHNLATTPLSEIDNTVRYCLLKLNGFEDFSDGYIVTPSGNILKEGHFFNTLEITPIEPIVYGNGTIINDKEQLNIKIVYPNNSLFNHGNFISSNNEIYILITFSKYSPKCKNRDGHFGIESKYLEGINPNEFFKISWDESNALTKDEYKENQERRHREEIKRIEKENRRKLVVKDHIKQDIDSAYKISRTLLESQTSKIPYSSKIPYFISVFDIERQTNEFEEYVDTIQKSLVSLNYHLKNL